MLIKVYGTFHTKCFPGSFLVCTAKQSELNLFNEVISQPFTLVYYSLIRI